MIKDWLSERGAANQLARRSRRGRHVTATLMPPCPLKTPIVCLCARADQLTFTQVQTGFYLWLLQKKEKKKKKKIATVATGHLRHREFAANVL